MDTWLFNPDADYVIGPNDTLILMGKPSNVTDFRKFFQL